MAPHPPQPWDLRGDLYASAFLVPAATVPCDEVPPGWTPVRLGGRLVVGAAWVDYRAPGVLAYREVMATVLVRRGVRVRPCIERIWVDSVASRDGGRALWAIPKELADFFVDGAKWTARTDDAGLASAHLEAGRALPVRLPARFSIVQRRAGEALVSPVRVCSRVSLARMRLDASGRLGFLAGRRPLGSFALRDFAMTFGERVPGWQREPRVVAHNGRR